ncbi:MAG: ribosome biogenesis GTPase Der [Candidatus Marinimicrobia bacterium]|nr:ribosome biogenesis GTPase Der [Candidatus Neomarinimicrobiota bacterium]MDD9888395.1 ribosome biogenesis GTPase Der [Candidatus Neomarinimicrobiota bacterium]MDD9930773.1 ribosome biogenesis GTPase Der [Candidatus Neomarinimicrobiota bacterium]
MANPIIAIVGRPNVGKSTFFNRMLKQKKAIVDAQEGITRDRLYGETEWVGHHLTFVDTGGYIPEDLDVFNKAVREQAQAAVSEADLILLMVDGREDPTASDKTLAQFVRESGKKAILVVNKCDNLETDVQVHGFHELAIEPIHPVSALTGRLSGDLLDLILKELNLSGIKPVEEKEAGMRLSIVGMPNVGKSSLTNALLQREQSIVTPIAGTTRDSIDAYLKYYGQTITLVDTAGLRKRSKVSDNIEFYSNVRTQRAILNSDVTLVLIDAEKGFSKQDKAIVDDVIKKGKGLVFIVNKWDLVDKENHTMKDFTDEIAYQFKALSHYPILFISAKTKQRVSKVLGLAQSVYETREKTISTAKLNNFLQKLLRQQSPPATRGKVINLKYMTQVNAAPHLFVIFTNYPKLVPQSYRRFIENQLRETFDLMGVPIRISFRRK